MFVYSVCSVKRFDNQCRCLINFLNLPYYITCITVSGRVKSIKSYNLFCSRPT